MVLIQKYKEENPLAIDKDWSPREMIHYARRISMMELFLCNKQMLSKLDHIERKDLMNEYRLKKSQKNNRIELYQHEGFQTIYLAIVKLLESENVDLIQNINMDIVMPYITTGILISKDVFKEINNAVNNYLLNDLRPISEESTDFEVYYSQIRGQYDVKTPKGSDVLAYYSSSEGWTEKERSDEDDEYKDAYPEAILIPTYGDYEGKLLSSTTRFNCHGYAWHGSEYVIYDTNEYRNMGWEVEIKKYWEDRSYKKFDEIPYPHYLNGAYPAKVSYTPFGDCDHSAVVANPEYFEGYNEYEPGWVISKWATGPLMCHHPYECPKRYTNSLDLLKYYRLDPYPIEGSTDDLCHPEERTFTTDLTDMPEGTLTWTHGPHVTHVPGTHPYKYKVVKSPSSNGNSFVEIDISTLTGFSWSDRIDFYAGTPVITNQKVDGYGYCYGMQICPGWHCLSVTPLGGSSACTTTWTVPPGIYYSVYPDDTTLDFLFPNFTSSITIDVESTNTCGTGPSRSFYLTKQIWGCDWWPYGMTIFPNPASDNVTVTMIENLPLVEYSDSSITGVAITDAKADESTTYTIRIYNSQGTLLSTWTRSGKDFNIPLINMREGTYIIEVSDGENSYRQQLIVKHN